MTTPTFTPARTSTWSSGPTARARARWCAPSSSASAVPLGYAHRRTDDARRACPNLTESLPCPLPFPSSPPGGAAHVPAIGQVVQPLRLCAQRCRGCLGRSRGQGWATDDCGPPQVHQGRQPVRVADQRCAHCRRGRASFSPGGAHRDSFSPGGAHRDFFLWAALTAMARFRASL